jgi:cobalt-zinc-cadmium efflux system outer membrane protein
MAWLFAGWGLACAQEMPSPETLEIKPLPPVNEPAIAQPPSIEVIPLGTPQRGAAGPLTLPDLESMALGGNPALAQAAAKVEAARGAWVQAGLPPNPTGGYVASEVGNEGHGGQQGGFFGQEIVTGGKLRLSRAVAAQEIRVAQQQFEAERLRVLSDVRIGFYEILVAQRRLEITQKLQQLSQRAVDTAKAFFEREEGNRVDLLQARVEAGSARILAENARNDYLAAWRKLSAVLGNPEMAPVKLVGDLEGDTQEANFEATLARVIAISPELAAARASVDSARAAVARARVEWVPNVELQASAQHDNASHYDIANVQAGVPIPIWNRNQGGVRRAQAELAAAQSNADRVELGLQQRLAIVFQRYANARQQVETYRKEILPDAQSSLDLVSEGYRQGEFGYLILLTSQRTFFQTNLAYLESLRQLRESQAAVDNLLLTDSLRSGTAGP